MSWEERYNELRAEYEQFQESSAELEEALQAELDAVTRSNESLTERVARLEQSEQRESQHANVQLVEMQKRVAELEQRVGQLTHERRCLEQENDDLARNARVLEFQLNEREIELESALEMNQLLAEELADAELASKESMQRMRDELRDARITARDVPSGVVVGAPSGTTTSPPPHQLSAQAEAQAQAQASESSSVPAILVTPAASKPTVRLAGIGRSLHVDDGDDDDEDEDNENHTRNRSDGDSAPGVRSTDFSVATADPRAMYATPATRAPFRPTYLRDFDGPGAGAGAGGESHTHFERMQRLEVTMAATHLRRRSFGESAAANKQSDGSGGGEDGKNEPWSVLGLARLIASLLWLPRLAISKWLPLYSLDKLVGDAIAGMTVGMMVVPQAMAYASVAGLPHVYGLYTAWVGPLVYCLLGTADVVSVGPTAIASLLVAGTVHGESGHTPPSYAVLLALMAGAMQMLMGFFKLGVIVDFISYPIISGFTTAAAITIAFGQLQHVFGLAHIRRPFYFLVYDVFSKLPHSRVYDPILGVLCIASILALQHLKRRMDTSPKSSKSGSRLLTSRVFWALCTARNAIVVLVASVFCYIMYDDDHADEPFLLIGKLSPGMPSPELPDMSWALVRRLWHSALAVAVIGFLEGYAIAKAFARQGRYVETRTRW